MAASLNQLSAAWATVVWTAVWQSTLLAVFVALLCLLLRHSSPNVRLWLWQIVAIKLLIAPVWSPAIRVPELSQRPAKEALPEDDLWSSEAAAWPSASLISAPPAPPGEVGANAMSAPSQWTPADIASTARLSTASWLLVIWASGVIVLLARTCVQRVRLTRLLAAANELDSPVIEQLIRECAAELSLRRVPRVLTAPEVGSPFVCGIARTVLVLSPGLVESLDPPQLRQAVLHELAHLKRRDLLWSWLPELARIVYWFHPVAHWARFRAHLERELACDQLALAHSGQSPASYAEMLVRVVSHVSQPASLRP